MGAPKTRIFARSRMRQERLGQGWIASDFARRIGVSRSALSGIELRKQGCSERVALEIAKVLHIDFQELFEVMPAHVTETEDEESVLVG